MALRVSTGGQMAELRERAFTGHPHFDPPPAAVVDEERRDWTVPEVRALYELPLPELVFRAQAVHRRFFPDGAVQLCSLLSVKTGGCSEDCSYCSQSARRETGVEAQKLLSVEEVVASAKEAKEAGATRFCMGAAWREVREGSQFESVLEMVRKVRALGLEACCTLGMLTPTQARRLREAGLSAYNHNLDTSAEFYGEVVSTHAYSERMETLRVVQEAGIPLCCGGIIGLGESVDDRCALLATLANRAVQPESVPVNALVAIPGTPLGDQAPVPSVELVRMVATARILMPRARVRLSAGRSALNEEAQLLCFLAGANSIFFGERLLTTGNTEYEADLSLLSRAGLRPLAKKRAP